MDTDILIDVGRGEQTAIEYLGKIEKRATLALSAVTHMELLVGCANKKEQQAVEQFVKRFEVLPITAGVTQQAVELLRTYRLSHGLLIADALIAATAMGQSTPLVSKNQRDYRFIDGLELWVYPPK